VSFWLRKVAGDLILSGGTFFGLLVVGAVLYLWPGGRGRRAARIVWAASAVLLYLLSTQPVSQSFMLPLETVHPVPTDAQIREAGATVVLSGGLAVNPMELERPLLSRVSVARTVAAVRLYKRFHTGPLIFAGGSGDPLAPGLDEGGAMRDLAVELGVPLDDVITENRSRTSGESARFTAALLEQRAIRRIVLVTSAFHLPRSVRLFRRQGLEVVPYPAEFASRPRSFQLRSFLPVLGRLYVVDTALHEYLGMLADR
jgi:uncharacterized SAM-binding protein YcdF (DUF218 family)